VDYISYTRKEDEFGGVQVVQNGPWSALDCPSPFPWRLFNDG
jgi:hypothetical protein